MPQIERTVTVTKPLSDVWEYLVDFTNTESWDPPTQSTTRVSGDGGVGTVYKNVSHMLGRDVEVEYTVLDVEPQRLFRLAGKTPSMDLLDTMTFEEADGRVSVTYTAELTPHGAAKLAEPLMPIGLKKIGDDAAEQLEKCLRDL
ncbi:SRPBCC family protein [Aeromicrobium terrae]|uniref:Polyketide cyclase n=1 Tax=Aeromicrobium terrae TaxID=2498846 RepID=A0A5C8NDW9_9ACTN|nr:SRPBCC family protein [Aeromicrobium terrae]TXL56537.1 polyketide cyclase [Aeromicrobium terrae]